MEYQSLRETEEDATSCPRFKVGGDGSCRYIIGCGSWKLCEGCAHDDDPKAEKYKKNEKDRNFWIFRLNAAAVFLHLVLFCVLLGIVADKNIELLRNSTTKIAVWEKWPPNGTEHTCKWSKNCAKPVSRTRPFRTANNGYFRIYDKESEYGRLSLAPLVLSFSALSFLFQGIRPFVGLAKTDYLQEVTERRINWLRWLEYAFSATTMILAIAFVLAINNIGAIMMLATSTAVTQLFGLVGELMLERKNGEYREDLFVAAWTAHLAGWVLQFGVFFTIFVSYFESVRVAESDGTAKPPVFVWAIVLSMALLFSSFGLCQLCDFIHRTCYDRTPPKILDGSDKSEDQGCCRKERCCVCGGGACKNGVAASDAFELTYIGLSLSAKALLSIIVAANLFLDMEGQADNLE